MVDDQSCPPSGGRIRLTDSLIRSRPFTRPGEQPYFDKDEIVRQLWAQYARQTVSFISVYYLGGKQHWVTIGHFPAMTVKEARDETLRIVAEAKRRHKFGVTPEDALEKFTWRDAWKLFQRRHRKAGKAASTLKDYGIAVGHIEHLMDWPMTPAKRIEFMRELEKVHDAMADRPAAANMVLFVVSTLHSAVRRTKLAELGPSPSSAIQPYERKPRKFDVSEDALRDCYQALQGIINPMRRLTFLMFLYTCLRKMEVAAIEWSHILPDRIWVPKPKGGEARAFHFPISRQMRAILDEAAQVRNNRVPWVFWSPNSHDGRIVNFNQSGVWTPHRFRHHYRTTAHRLSPDVQFYTAELLMNHKLQATFGEVAMGYIHDGDGDFDRMAAANQMIADEIDRILGN